MAESPEKPLPPITTPDTLITEPELVAPDLTGNAALPSAPPAGRRAAATFIFFTVTLDMLALGMIAPVLPRLIEGFLHGDTSSAAKMLGLFGTVFAAMQFFFSPILGSLSDRFGRRPVVLLSNFGLGFDYLLMAWAPALSWLFVGRVISGLTASSIPTAMAYMADVTPRERRAAAFGMLNAAFGIGFVLGPAMGGLLGNINPRLPFWVAGGLSLINGLYGLFVLPESLSLANRSPFSWARANPVGSLKLLNRGGMLAISGVLLLGYFAQQVLMNVYVIYDDYRYHWTNRTVGLSLATVGVFTVIYGALLIKPVIAKVGERGAMTIGLIGGAIGYSMIGSSKTGLLLWFGIPVLNLMSFTWPSAQSLLSRKTSPSEQGQLQGAINSLRGIAGLIGPGFFTYIFSKSIGANAIISSPGTPFYVAAAMLLIGLILAQYATRKTQPAVPS
ncbi:TCR/Tet family MFS transporter [Tunturiibacter empetritectus]|uniref:DHA1 family tetracycline resistance protein-like MFS transporter n=2 Tax=Tunturiibacter TaxID=3154218 RepID=A0A852VNT6_9BACT|nr:TCR/Tet family MFS transporter [Edaphobacter lichenicola]NYF91725.1 DHA1 family tetracycline resistance protein-like MFS transporter [Edaphobacter lichenicola]